MAPWLPIPQPPPLKGGGEGRPGQLQPYCRYERLFVKDRPDTYFPSFGLNYYLKGQNAKLSVEWTQITQQEDHAPSGNYSGGDQNLVTVQGQVGF
ncbi:MAG: hypothetical protein ACLFUU_05520 [Desulfobacteraceae bacterium]